MRWVVLLCAFGLASAHDVAKPATFVVGSEFRMEMQRSISASWKNIALRDILRRIGEERGIAILRDRRIDPDQRLTLDVQNEPISHVAKRVARLAGGDLTVVGSVVFLGPAEVAAKVRTLIALRANELAAMREQIGDPRFRALAERRSFSWELSTPNEIVDSLAGQRGMIQLEDHLPHDLWAPATLPNVTTGEALTLILSQFDLTFVWGDMAHAIRSNPVPRAVVVEKSYRPRQGSVQTFAERLSSRLGRAVSVERNAVIVRATVEEHERLLQPGGRQPETKTGQQPVPLSRREFTLVIQSCPVQGLMQKLEKSGIRFEYDSEKLKAAGIRLDGVIDMNVEKVNANGFFRAMCEPLGLDFDIDGVTVRLRPAEK